jgi:hypothetical protein
VVEETLPEGVLDGEDPLVPQPDRSIRRGWSEGGRRPDRSQDHRRHVRWHGPSRWWCVLRQGPEQGRPLRRLRARWVAKHVVAKNWAERCEVQVAYAIGIAEPVSIRCDTFGTLNQDAFPDEVALTARVRDHFGSFLRPGKLIEHFKLKRPIYRPTAAYGHFGRPDFPWEQLDQLESM